MIPILALVALAIHFYIFFCSGWLVKNLLHLKTSCPVLLCIMGFFTYFTLFEFFCLPAILGKIHLSTFSYCWVSLCALLCLYVTWRNSRSWLDQAQGLFARIRREQWSWLALILVVVAIQGVMVLFNQNVTADSAYYIGMVNTALYTDTMELFSPYTGLPEAGFDFRYVLSTYPMHNAVFAKIFHLPALVQTRTIMNLVVILLVNGAYFLVARLIAKDNLQKTAILMALILLVNIALHPGYYGVTYLYYRTYEGKPIIGNLYLTMVLYYALILFQRDRESYAWWGLFLLATSGVAISSSALFLVPVAIFIALVPLALARRKKHIFYQTILCLLPCCLYLGAYFLEV